MALCFMVQVFMVREQKKASGANAPLAPLDSGVLAALLVSRRPHPQDAPQTTRIAESHVITEQVVAVNRP